MKTISSLVLAALATPLSAATVLVVDGGGNRVQQFESQTSGAWTSSGAVIPAGTYGGSAFNNPFGIAFNGSHLFVSEGVAGGRVLQFTTSGTYVKTVYDFGTATTPRYLAMAPDGNLLMTDAFGTSGDNVWKIDVVSDTATILITTAAGAFNNPQGITIGGDGNLYVADRQTNRIKQFSTAGALLNANFATVTNPIGLVWEAANNRFLAGAGFSGDLVSISAAGAVTGLLNETHGEGFLDAVSLDGKTYVSRFSSGSATGGVFRLTGATTTSEVTDGIFAANSSQQMVVIPEPASWLLGVAALVPGCLMRRKRD